MAQQVQSLSLGGLWIVFFFFFATSMTPCSSESDTAQIRLIEGIFEKTQLGDATNVWRLKMRGEREKLEDKEHQDCSFFPWRSIY